MFTFPVALLTGVAVRKRLSPDPENTMEAVGMMVSLLEVAVKVRADVPLSGSDRIIFRFKMELLTTIKVSASALNIGFRLRTLSLKD
jgi:hypothetical protein